MTNQTRPFWQSKSLSEMNRDEWESLCDHCGKCCLLKLQDEDEDESVEESEEVISEDNPQGSVYYTNVVCNLFDKKDGHCSDY